MVCRARLVPGLRIEGSRALAAFGKVRRVTTPTSFATVAEAALTQLPVAAAVPDDEGAAEITSLRWG